MAEETISFEEMFADLYMRVSPDEPCQFVAVHPVRWFDRGEPTAAFVELDYSPVRDIVRAAPDMLAALESSAKMLEAVADSYDERGWDSSSIRENELAQVRAAIARAKGQEASE